jgi:hypothetical protein
LFPPENTHQQVIKGNRKGIHEIPPLSRVFSGQVERDEKMETAAMESMCLPERMGEQEKDQLLMMSGGWLPAEGCLPAAQVKLS